MTRVLVLVGIIALQLLSCGGSGDDQICPHGNCTIPASTVVKWMFDNYPQWMFQSDSCTDLQIATVHVDMVDGAGNVTSQDASCNDGQATFVGLPAGPYTASITPLDAGGNLLVSAPISGPITAATTNVETTLQVPYTAWVGTYTGTFLFRLSWAGVSCSMTLPKPVTKQVLTLTVNGQVVSQVTDSGQKLDGSDPEMCRELTEAFPQSATMVPFGPATFLVIGKDNGSKELFHHQFDTFIGAGISNPTMTFDVPPDAGPDAPPDAQGGD